MWTNDARDMPLKERRRFLGFVAKRGDYTPLRYVPQSEIDAMSEYGGLVLSYTRASGYICKPGHYRVEPLIKGSPCFWTHCLCQGCIGVPSAPNNYTVKMFRRHMDAGHREYVQRVADKAMAMWEAEYKAELEDSKRRYHLRHATINRETKAFFGSLAIAGAVNEKLQG